MSNNPSPGGGRTISDYFEPILTALATCGAAFGSTYFLTNDQQRGAFTPLIVGTAAGGAQLATSTLLAPTLSNTFGLQNKSIAPPQIVDQPNPQFNNTAGARYIPNPQSPLYAHQSVYPPYVSNQQLYYPYYPEDFGRRHHKKKKRKHKRH